MAINIPIWTGTSTFTAGKTPFGFFDTDPSFIIQADKVANWAARRLGYPISDIELQDIHFYTAFEEAILEYSNIVNQFSIKDNLFNLQGTPINGTTLTGSPINPTLHRLISIAKNYGTEAGSGGYIKYKKGYIEAKRGQQEYILSQHGIFPENIADKDKSIEIKKLYHESPPAFARYFGQISSASVDGASLMDQFGFHGYQHNTSFIMMPMHVDLLRLQAIEFNNLVRKSAYSFSITGNAIRLFPIPRYDINVYFDYITAEERASASFANIDIDNPVVGDFSSAPYTLHTYDKINAPGKEWIYKYTLAIVKEILGNIRSKYSSIPIPNAEVTLNGSELISQSQTEKDLLVAQLREDLDATSRQSQMQKMSEEADSIQLQLSKIPLSVYIG